MKTLMSLAFATLLFVVFSGQASAQQSSNGAFNSFRAHREGKAGVTLNWSVSSPDIARFVVERSYDGEFFEEVTPVDCTGSGMYKYKDTGVFPGRIHYRVTAVKTDGSTESSAVETVRIVQRG